jgi:lysophospholipase L1-like esterase
MEIFKIGVISLSIFSFLSQASLRSPAFSDELVKTFSAGIVDDQDDLISKDGSVSRPVWLMAGDSLSSGWANHSNLYQRYRSAFDSSLPGIMSLPEIFNSRPKPSYTWYAGSQLDYGIFGFLNPKWLWQKVKPSWILVATALAGAELLPEKRIYDKSLFTSSIDAVEEIEKFHYGNRVMLLTLSIGSNDICKGVDAVKYQNEVESKLYRIRAHLNPRTSFVVWKVPQIDQVYGNIMRALSSLPQKTKEEAKAKNAVVQYCYDAWKYYCPAIFTDMPRLYRSRNNFNRLYLKYFGSLFDSRVDDSKLSNSELLNLVSSDCFHPSPNGHQFVRNNMKAYLKKIGF